MKCLFYLGISPMKEGTSAEVSGRDELHGGARVTTLVTLRKCTLGFKREIKILKLVLASTKVFKGGLAWIKPSKKDMAVTFSYFLRQRPVVQELISRGAQDVCLGTNTQEDHLIPLGEFFAICQKNHTRPKLEKYEFMQETMQYLELDIGYGWWSPAASKPKPLMDAKVRHLDPKKGLDDVRSFIGACHFHCRHIKNFTCTRAILTDLISNATTWR